MSGDANRLQHSQRILDQIADEVTERFNHGENPSVDEYVRLHPHLVYELDKIFSAITILRDSRRSDIQDKGQ